MHLGFKPRESTADETLLPTTMTTEPTAKESTNSNNVYYYCKDRDKIYLKFDINEKNQ